jgi:hypothetical protein
MKLITTVPTTLIVVALLAIVATNSRTVKAQTASVQQTYQAEDATAMSGGATVESGPNVGFTGTGYADYGDKGSFVEWSTIPTSADGDYTISIRYASVNQRPLDVYIDGTKKARFEIRSAGSNWNVWTEESVKVVGLAKGGHTIKLVAADGDGPNIDWIALRGPPPPSSSSSITRATVLGPDQYLKRGEFRGSPGGTFQVGDRVMLCMLMSIRLMVVWFSNLTLSLSRRLSRAAPVLLFSSASTITDNLSSMIPHLIRTIGRQAPLGAKNYICNSTEI